MKQKNWAALAVRIVLLLAGLTIAHLGVALFLRSDLGSTRSTCWCRAFTGSCPGPGG